MRASSESGWTSVLAVTETESDSAADWFAANRLGAAWQRSRSGSCVESCSFGQAQTGSSTVYASTTRRVSFSSFFMLQDHSLAMFADRVPSVPGNDCSRTGPSITTKLADRWNRLQTLKRRNQFATDTFETGSNPRGRGAANFDRSTERGRRAASAWVGQELPSVPPDASAPTIELNPDRIRGGAQDGCR